MRAIRYAIQQTGAEEVASAFDTISGSMKLSAEAVETARKAISGLNRSLTGSLKRLNGLSLTKAINQFTQFDAAAKKTEGVLSEIAERRDVLKSLGTGLAQGVRSANTAISSFERSTTKSLGKAEKAAKSLAKTASESDVMLPQEAGSGVKEIATQFSVLEGVIQRANSAASSNEGWKELRNRIENSFETMIEFGASPREAIRNLKVVQQVAGRTGVQVATLAKVAEKFSDEAESASVTARDLARALDFAALSGERVEDSARLVALATKGQGDALNVLDDRAKAAGRAIDKIRDPQLRAKLITEEIARAQARQNSIITKATDRWKAFKVSLELTSPAARLALRGFKLLGGAILGAAVALGGVFTSSIKTFLKQNVRTQKAIKGTKKAWDDVKFTLGAVILGYNDAGKNIKRTTGFLKKFNSFIKKNAKTVQALVKGVARGVVFVAGGAAKILLAFGGVVTFLLEGVQNLVQLTIEIINDSIFFAQDLILRARRIFANDEETKKLEDQMRSLREEYEVTKKKIEKPVDFGLTEKIDGFLDLISQAQGQADDFISGFGTGKGNDFNNLGPRKRPGAKKVEPLDTEIRRIEAEIKNLERLEKALRSDLDSRESLNANNRLGQALLNRVVLLDKTATLQEKNRIAARGLRQELKALTDQVVSANAFESRPEAFELLSSRGAALGREVRDLRARLEKAQDALGDQAEELFAKPIKELERRRDALKTALSNLGTEVKAENVLENPAAFAATNPKAAAIAETILKTRQDVERIQAANTPRTSLENDLQAILNASEKLRQIELSQSQTLQGFLLREGDAIRQRAQQNAARIDLIQPSLQKLLDIETQIAQIENPNDAGLFVGSTDPELHSILERINARERELKTLQAFKEANEQALTQGSNLALDFAASLARTSAAGGDVSDVLRQSVSGAIGQIVPLFQAYGTALVAAGTLNPFALFAATAVLSALTGAAQGFISGDSSPRTNTTTSVNRGDALQRSIEREREQEDRSVNVTVFVGNEALDKRFIQQQQQNRNLGLLRGRRDRRG